MNGQNDTSAPDPSGCVSIESLQAYVGGWSDNRQSEIIEQHLAWCQSCEQTLVSLEEGQDTLIASLRGTSMDERSSQSAQDSIVGAALLAARQNALGANIATSPFEFPESIGPYDLIRAIGSGGMGAVYLARHRDLGKQVAIKLVAISPRGGDQRFERFRRETRAAGGLRHAAIVNATDAGQQGSVRFLVMEHIEGLDLGRICRSVGRLSIPDACEIIRVAATALAYAHGEGVVHRDIKPSNLMIDRDGKVKLLDFGLARITDWDDAGAELTTIGQLMGTLDYVSPEQAERPDAADHRADIYSLGATIYRLIAGRSPHATMPNLSPIAKLKLLSDHDPPHLKTLREDVPDELSSYVSQMLDRDPNHRPASAAHVSQAVAGFADGHALKSLVQRAEQCALQESPSTRFMSIRAEVPIHTSPENNKKSERTGLLGWVVAALVSLIVVAGIVITVESYKGQLVIDSEVDDINIRLLKNGKTYDELKVVTGANATRLFAGRYEVVIGSESDSVVVSEDELTIKRGETTIVKVLATALAKTDDDMVRPISQPKLPASNEPLAPGQRIRLSCVADRDLELTMTVMADHTIKTKLLGVISVKNMTLKTLEDELNVRYRKFYDEPMVEVFFDEQHLAETHTAGEKIDSSGGEKVTRSPLLREPVFDEKNLESWLNVIRYEHARDDLLQAFFAVHQLATPESLPTIQEICLQRLPDIDENVVDSLFFTLKSHLSEEAFKNLLIDQLRSENAKIRQRTQSQINSNFREPHLRAAFLQWFRSDVFSGESDYPETNELAYTLDRLIEQHETNNAVQSELIQLIVSGTKLGKVEPMFWLGRSCKEIWEQNLQFEVAQNVIISLGNNDSPANNVLLSLALLRLQQQHRTVMDRDLDFTKKPKLIEAIKSHLQRFAKSSQHDIFFRAGRSNDLADSLGTIPEFKAMRQQLFQTPEPSNEQPLWHKRVAVLHSGNKTGRFSPLLEILDLLITCGGHEQCRAEIMEFHRSTEASYRVVENLIDAGKVSVVLDWPNMAIARFTRRGDTSKQPVDQDVELPTRKQWFDYFVHIRTRILLERLDAAPEFGE